MTEFSDLHSPKTASPDIASDHTKQKIWVKERLGMVQLPMLIIG